jgi:hypothetical protein
MVKMLRMDISASKKAKVWRSLLRLGSYVCVSSGTKNENNGLGCPRSQCLRISTTLDFGMALDGNGCKLTKK